MIRIAVLFCFSLVGCSQAQPSLQEHLQNLAGIWVEARYCKVFSKTSSALASMTVFDPNYPVALRIQPKEQDDSYFRIGYGVLHDHMLHPEISGCKILATGDSICEQSYFMVNSQRPDSLNFYRLSPNEDFFNYECDAFFSWEYGTDTVLLLYRPASAELPELTVRYVRVARSFKDDYPYPNPLYYFTRVRLLAGTFTVKDAAGKVVCTKLIIGEDGKMAGFLPFKNRLCYFSTDVYCGPQETEDVVLCCLVDDASEFDCDAYYYHALPFGVFQFLERKYNEESEEYEVGKVKYTFIKHG
ncbi:MAG: hypothetical protein JNJ57_16535 [Saprospiraceae bacterium]|nr:hypothetical protein [Saprospiraceae bacterium]